MGLTQGSYELESKPLVSPLITPIQPPEGFTWGYFRIYRRMEKNMETTTMEGSGSGDITPIMEDQIEGT